MGWQNFPMITCPHCEKEFQVDDYYDIEADSSFECSYCEKTIYVWATDHILSGDIQALKG